MFERFERILHGQSPIGNIDGIWGYLKSNGKWFLLNAHTTDAQSVPSLRPSDIGDVVLVGTLGRMDTEHFAERLLQYAKAQGSWAPIPLEKKDEFALADLDFMVDCGWLTKEGQGYHYTIGFVLLMVSRSYNK